MAAGRWSQVTTRTSRRLGHSNSQAALVAKKEEPMFSRSVIPALVGTLVLAAGCQAPESVSAPEDAPAFANAPSTGNGHKLVIQIDEPGPAVLCDGGATLDAHVQGWIQVRLFDHGPNLELDVFHIVLRFTNAAGRTYTFRDVGPDHFYLKDGNVFVASSGRISGGLIGRIVTNLTTGETVFIAGKQFAGVESLACAALT
jgi:hypothetical protein